MLATMLGTDCDSVYVCCAGLPSAMVLLSKDQLDAQKEKGKGAKAVTNSVLKDKEMLWRM